MIPVIRLGPATIQTSSLALILALWIGTYLAERDLRRRGGRGDEAWSIVAIGVATTVFIARVGYVAQNMSTYSDDWFQIFALTPSTLDLPTGGLFGALAIFGYLQHRHWPIAQIADGFVRGAFVALAILALGHFLSGDSFGTPTDLPWAIPLWGIARHPVQLYELLGLAIGMIVVTRADTRPGARALIALAWYSALRLIVDGWRADAVFLPNGYRVSQIIALTALLIVLWVMMHLANEERTHA